AEMRALRNELSAALTGGTLHDVETRDLALAISFLEVQIAEHESRHFQRANPSLAIGEAGFGLIALMPRPFAPIDHRAPALAERPWTGCARRPRFSTARGARWSRASPTNGVRNRCASWTASSGCSATASPVGSNPKRSPARPRRRSPRPPATRWPASRAFDRG